MGRQVVVSSTCFKYQDVGTGAKSPKKRKKSGRALYCEIFLNHFLLPLTSPQMPRHYGGRFGLIPLMTG
jgi:hypothetical protein